MLGNILGMGIGLVLVVGTCAALALVLWVYRILTVLFPDLGRKDPGLTSMGLHHGGLREPDFEQTLHDITAPPTGAVTVEDLSRPALFIPGVDALPPTRPPR